jgi:hypothetical protein
MRIMSFCEECGSGREWDGVRGSSRWASKTAQCTLPKVSPVGTIPLLALLMFSGAFIRSKIFRKSRTLYAVEDSHLLVSMPNQCSVLSGYSTLKISVSFYVRRGGRLD